MITDGPHGLRKAAQSTSMDIEHSMPATCFPPAAGMASSWNPGLVREVGVAIGEECVQEKVAVLLGPGVNIKGTHSEAVRSNSGPKTRISPGMRP